jgi:hypothetical protein
MRKKLNITSIGDQVTFHRLDSQAEREREREREREITELSVGGSAFGSVVVGGGSWELSSEAFSSSCFSELEVDEPSWVLL